MANNDRDTFRELRQKFGSSDPFMAGGHQIIKSRTGRGRKKSEIPLWARNDIALQAILLRSFPNLKTSSKQRARAARWVRVVQLYFRMGWTRGQVAAEMKVKPAIVKVIVERIRRVASGRRSRNNSLELSTRGRPRKNRVPIGTSLGINAKPNLFRTRSLVSSRTSRKSKRHTCRRVQVRPRRSRS